MTLKKITVPNLLGEAYYQYELTSSTYNATISTAFTITCTVTNIRGNPVNGKSITLYHNGTSVSTQTTDSNGVATWTITPTTLGLHDFNVNKQHIQVDVDGWVYHAGNSTNNYMIYKTKKFAKLVLSGYSLSNVGTGWTQFGGSSANYCSTIRPNGHVSGYNSNANILFRVAADGKIYYKSMTGSTVSSDTAYLQLLWSIRDEDL